MNREIKFRAWDAASERMLSVSEPKEQGKREYYPFEVCIGFSHWNKNDIILMQYTGLKDKNGKEIYEGDTVIHSSRNGGKPHSIVFHKGCFMGDYGLLYPLHNERMNEDCEIEVIGNIYENPELI